MRFTNRLKKGGLYVVGHVVPGQLCADTMQTVRRQTEILQQFKDSEKVRRASFYCRVLSRKRKRTAFQWLGHHATGTLRSYHRCVAGCCPAQTRILAPDWQLTRGCTVVAVVQIKAFFKFSVNPSFRNGAKDLLMMSGLGGLEPNTLVVGLPEATQVNAASVSAQEYDLGGTAEPSPADDGARGPLAPPSPSLEEYAGVLHDANLLGMNLCVTRGLEQLSGDFDVTSGTIDVWLLPRGRAPLEGVAAGAEYEGLGEDDTPSRLVLQLGAILQVRASLSSNPPHHTNTGPPPTHWR